MSGWVWFSDGFWCGCGFLSVVMVAAHVSRAPHWQEWRQRRRRWRVLSREERILARRMGMAVRAARRRR